MKLTFLLPALLALGAVSGSALGAPNERENSKNFNNKIKSNVLNINKTKGKIVNKRNAKSVKKQNAK